MSITRHHNDWLSLVPNSGPFLSLPVLASAFPQGLDAHDADHARRLRMAFDEWDDNQLSNRPDPGLHRAWVKFVLGETLGYEELLAEGQAIPTTLKSEVAEYGETLRPDWIVNDPATKKARLIVQFFPRSQSLTKPVASSRWKTSPDTRMMQLLHDTGIRLGIITNGDHWMLVNAPKNETTGYASWYANLWLEEPVTQRAFRTVLGADRLFSVPEKETLEALLDKSAADQQEVTDQLGYQVRKAVEVLIQSLDKADQEHGRKLLADVDEKILYESALTVMMRLVFLFCAEERELLLLGDELYDKNYAVSTLREQLISLAEEEVHERRYDAWCRLLTTFRSVYAGAKHDRLKLPAYGGSLFNPDRFPFLEGRKLGTSWKTTEATPLPVSNRTVLHLLEALQVLQTKVGNTTEARKISFRALDIEQIGHVYEGLLDHTAKRATEPVLGLAGTRNKEPEIALAELEKIAAKGEKEFAKFLKDETGRSESAIKKGLNAELDDQLTSRFRTACQDSDLWKRVQPFAGLVRLDTVSYPVVITKGSVFVTSGTDRRSSGTHYTPKSLTEPIVQYTLEPLVYVGPAEGLPKEEWKLRSAKELLALKICDMACGSGAFLVQACRYMAARLLEAWDAVQRANPGMVHITPEGEPSTGKPGEMLIPDDPDERQTYALRIVAQRCLYGVDINPLATEMAKLSLWLLTLAKDKPFEFLDHAIRCGDSLVGIHNTEQLKKFNLDGKGEDNRLFLHFLDEKIKDAITLRRQIIETQAVTVDDVEAQDRMLREANEKIDRLKCAADLLIAAEFVPGSAADKRAARDNAAINVAVHFNDSDLPTFRREVQVALAGRMTFHWPLEFPEVMVERGGFDAFVGNPPFQGGTVASTSLGIEYMAFIKRQNEPWHGKADFVGAFFRKASALHCRKGFTGFLATASLIRGETVESSLVPLINRGAVLYRGRSPFPWPGQANVTAVCIWLSTFDWNSPRLLDEAAVEAIGPDLEPIADGALQEVYPLSQNRPFAGLGVKLAPLNPVLQKCDVTSLSPLVRKTFIYVLGGDEIYGLHTLSDAPMAMDPTSASEESMMEFARSTGRVVCLNEVVHSAPAKALMALAACAKYLFACGETTHKQLAFVQVPKVGFLLKHKAVGFPADSWATFALLQSEIHVTWAWKHGIRRKEDLCYSPKRCAETFPVWSGGAAEHDQALESIGSKYHELRHLIQRERKWGITNLYNRFHDPTDTSADIQKLRELHVEMDDAVAAAYGWTDLDLGHGFHETKQGVRYTISEPARREVLARLLKLNHERHAEEVKQGLHDKKKPKATKGKKEAKANTDAGPSLFHEEEDA